MLVTSQKKDQTAVIGGSYQASETTSVRGITGSSANADLLGNKNADDHRQQAMNGKPEQPQCKLSAPKQELDRWADDGGPEVEAKHPGKLRAIAEFPVSEESLQKSGAFSFDASIPQPTNMG